MIRSALALTAVLVLLGSTASAQLAPTPLEIREDVRLPPATHPIPGEDERPAIRILADGVTLDLGEAVLAGASDGADPDGFQGVGILVEGRRDVTIRGGSIRGYRVAIRARDCVNLHVEGVDVSGNFRQRLRSTPEKEDTRDWLRPHFNDEGEWESRYGAGIGLTDCPGAVVSRCRARDGQNGLLLTRCDGAHVDRNDFSFLSGWGVALWRSSRCTVVRNRLDWCVRGYSHGVYDRGQDSAGILVFEQCRDNVFAFNSATHGGDGFFLYAGHETTQRTGLGGSGGNILYRNDFSHAVANGIEATFSEGNAFLENRLDDCNYGVWAGYSRRTVVRGNVARGCTFAGIGIEHGTDNVIEGNVLGDCRRGVWLWWDEDPDLTGGVYGEKQDTASARSIVRGNRIEGCRAGVLLDRSRNDRIQANEIVRNEVALALVGDVTGLRVLDNAIGASAKATVLNRTGGVVSLGANLWLDPVTGDDVRAEEGDVARPRTERWRPLPTEWPFLPQETPRGRARIVVDEWGPFDFRTPRLWPARVDAGARAVLHLLGPDLPFRVEAVTEGLQVEPRDGRAPTRLVVTPEGNGPAIREGRVLVAIGEHALEATVRLLAARWRVRHWAWTADPREDAEAFRKLLVGDPLHEETRDELDLRWGVLRPAAGVPADRFATVAETVLTLPSGTYEIVTVSDDGVRVLVDGETVLENWTWHGPTEDRATVRLEAGAHRVRVEHFEIDGHAVLSFRLRRVK
jgi:nitrous oxidase accessory protein NosD